MTPESFKVSKFQKYFPLLLLLAILAVGAFFRFYRIREYMTFLGDEGRDVLVVKRMIVDHKFTLLGPITSVGSMYLGPIYYYFMLPFLWFFHLDPVGPAVGIALLSLATIFLIYKTGRDFLSEKIGLLSAFLYAISPLPIIYGRASWNPNAVPFVAMIMIYSLLKTAAQKKYSWYLIFGLGLGVILQLHYISLIFVPIIIVAMLVFHLKPRISHLFLLLAGWVITFSPFLFFELRHNFTNTLTIWKFITKEGGQGAFSIGRFIFNFSDLLVRLFWRLVVILNAELTKVLIFSMFIALVIYLKRKIYLKDRFFPAIKLLLIWFSVSMLFYGLYRGVIYDYYFVPLFPLPYILIAIYLVYLARSPKWRWWSYSVLVAIVLFNLNGSPLKKEPNNMVRNTEEIARFIENKAENKPYNFALLTGSNSDHAYRYFLEIWGHPPVSIEVPQADPTRKSVTDQLLVVCEDKICHPLGHPLWEVAGFGRAEIIGQWQVNTVKVFKLVHYQGV